MWSFTRKFLNWWQCYIPSLWIFCDMKELNTESSPHIHLKFSFYADFRQCSYKFGKTYLENREDSTWISISAFFSYCFISFAASSARRQVPDNRIVLFFVLLIGFILSICMWSRLFVKISKRLLIHLGSVTL